METASVVESEGRPVTSGRHSQQYPLEVRVSSKDISDNLELIQLASSYSAL